MNARSGGCRHVGWLLGSLVLVLVVTGCGEPPPIRLTGRVMYRGAPLPGGSIRLHFDGGRELLGIIQQNGQYQIVNPPAGTAAVSVETESVKAALALNPLPNMPPDPSMKLPMPSQMPGGLGDYIEIPSRYNSPQTSGLAINVTGKDQKKDIQLTD